MNPGGQRVLRTNRAPNFLAIKDEARSFSSVIGMRRVEWSLIDRGTPIPVYVALVSPGSFALLGARVQVGRVFTDAEEQTGIDANVIVLSHSLWQRQFGSRREVVGSTVRVDDHVATVVGVLSPGFSSPTMPKPGCLSASARPPTLRWRRSPAWLQPCTRAQAEAELDAIAARAEAVRPVAESRGAIRDDADPRIAGRRSDAHDARADGRGDPPARCWLRPTSPTCCSPAASVAPGRLRSGPPSAPNAARQVRQTADREPGVRGARHRCGPGRRRAAQLRSLVDLVPNTLRDQLGLTQSNIDWRAAIFAAAITGSGRRARGIGAGAARRADGRQRHAAPELPRRVRRASHDARAGGRRSGIGGGPADERRLVDRQLPAPARRRPRLAIRTTALDAHAAAAALRHRRATDHADPSADGCRPRAAGNRARRAGDGESARSRQLRRRDRIRGSTARARTERANRQPSAGHERMAADRGDSAPQGALLRPHRHRHQYSRGDRQPAHGRSHLARRRSDRRAHSPAATGRTVDHRRRRRR